VHLNLAVFFFFVEAYVYIILGILSL